MLKRKKRRGIHPLWVFALAYLFYSLAGPMLRFSALLIGLGLASAACAAAEAVFREKAAADEVIPDVSELHPDADRERFSPAVESIIADGDLALREMGRLYGSIRNESVRQRINELMAVSDKIIQDAKEDEADVPQIRRFLDFYLPTTLKLLNAYDRMDAAEIEGSTVSGSKKSIEEMLDTAIAAYQKQLDALFENQALDIDAEIRSMKSMLSREGFGETSPLDWNSFKAQYDKEEKEKGTVQNG